MVQQEECKSALNDFKKVQENLKILRFNFEEFQSDSFKEKHQEQQKIDKKTKEIANLTKSRETLSFFQNKDSSAIEAICYEDSDLETFSHSESYLLKEIRRDEEVLSKRNRHLNLHIFSEYRAKLSHFLQVKSEFETLVKMLNFSLNRLKEKD